MNKGLVPSEKGLVVGVSVLVGLDYLVSRQIPGLHNTVLFNENGHGGGFSGPKLAVGIFFDCCRGVS